ncbi:hypothetical protein L9F63_010972, partial [Diploptera punctata]
MSEGDMLYGTSLSLESIKVIAESVGVGNLPDEAAKQLADDVSYRLKQIIQNNRYEELTKPKSITVTQINYSNVKSRERGNGWQHL